MEEDSPTSGSSLDGRLEVEDYISNPNLEGPPQLDVNEILEEDMSGVDELRFINGLSSYEFGTKVILTVVVMRLGRVLILGSHLA